VIARPEQPFVLEPDQLIAQQEPLSVLDPDQLIERPG
jgi:hypothetical protein